MDIVRIHWEQYQLHNDQCMNMSRGLGIQVRIDNICHLRQQGLLE